MSARQKPFPAIGHVWAWLGDADAPPCEPRTITGMRWFNGRAEALFGDHSCAGVEHMMTQREWQLVSETPPDARRADLLTLLAIASGHAPPFPYVEYRCAGRDERRPPTPDEWAAYLVTHADALGRAVDARPAAQLDVRPDDASTLEDRIVAAWRESGMPLGKLLVDAMRDYEDRIGVIGRATDWTLVEMIEGYVRGLKRSP